MKLPDSARRMSGALWRLARGLTGRITVQALPQDQEVPSYLPEADQPRSAEPSQSYVICSIPRSGSNLLSHGLWTSGLGGKPAEYFHRRYCLGLMERWGTVPVPLRPLQAVFERRLSLLSLSRPILERYLRDLKRNRTGENGVFGVKLHFVQYRWHIHPRALRETFPGARFIHISRRDHVRQAVSFARASQTGRFRGSSVGARAPSPVYDSALVRRCHQQIVEAERGWEALFRRERIEPMTIAYEDLAHHYEASVLAVLRFVGADVPDGFELPPPRLTRQADAVSEAWIERYRSELARAGTEVR